ncbi:unnamed protein product, partial [marine sediment metagenome]
MKVSRVHEMRDLDRRAIEEYGIVQEILMENAGQASYFTILKELGVKNKNFVIFCGDGNNGGDGLVVARKIHSNGGKVSVFILGDRSKFKGAAKQNFNIVDKFQIEMFDLQDVSSAMEVVKSAEIKKPLLIDGDGISAVANDWEYIKKRKAPTILTPHLGEMARIAQQKI